MSRGMLIVIDGIDGSGKETQTKLLYENLIIEENMRNIKKITFPNYDSPSSALVKMYLGGEFGLTADDVSAYAASTFYAVDRYASYKKDWGKNYNNGDIIISDRYVSSNMIHQASKFKTTEEKDKFLDWLYNHEYNVLDLPKPDITFFLYVPLEFTLDVIKKRKENSVSKTNNVKDIHEDNIEHLKLSRENAVYVSEKYNFCTIHCVEDGKMRTMEDISNEILHISKLMIDTIKILKENENNKNFIVLKEGK